MTGLNINTVESVFCKECALEVDNKAKKLRFMRFSLLALLALALIVTTKTAYAEKGSVFPSSLVVMPLQNKTGDSDLDWLSIALQESLNIDAWYLPLGIVHPLPGYSGAKLSKICSGMEIGCAASLTQKQLIEIAKEKDYLHVIAGSYTKDSNQSIQLELVLLEVKTGKEIARTSKVGALGFVTKVSSNALLELVSNSGLQISKQQKERVLRFETNSIDRLKKMAWDSGRNNNILQSKTL